MAKREFLTADEAIAMLPPGDMVHTFKLSAGVLLGARWSRDAIIDLIREREPELSGERATEMDHRLTVLIDDAPLFIETKK